MVWLVTHMWIALAGAGVLGLLFGSSIRGMMLRGKTRTAIVERDVAQTELDQARGEIEALYAAQRKSSDVAPEPVAEPSGADDALKAELSARESRIAEISEELASARTQIETLKKDVESRSAADLAKAGAAALAGAAAGAAATASAEKPKPLDADLDKEKADLVMRNRFLESRVRNLETVVSEMNERATAEADAQPEVTALAETPVAASVDTRDDADATDATAGEDVSLAKIRWQNEYLRQRLAVLEENAVAAQSLAPAAAPQPDPEPATADSSDEPDESADEELARLRWRNRYLEGRVAYFEGDADVAAGPDADSELSLASDPKPAEVSAVAETRKPDPEPAPAPAGPTGLAAVAGAPTVSAAVAEATKPETHQPDPAISSEEPATPLDDAAEIAGDVERPESLAAPRGEADELTRIGGIGPMIADVLNKLGVFHIDQIAAWDDANVAWVDEELNLGGRIVREGWVSQAKAITKPN